MHAVILGITLFQDEKNGSVLDFFMLFSVIKVLVMALRHKQRGHHCRALSRNMPVVPGSMQLHTTAAGSFSWRAVVCGRHGPKPVSQHRNTRQNREIIPRLPRLNPDCARRVAEWTCSDQRTVNGVWWRTTDGGVGSCEHNTTRSTPGAK